tara:strand:+ start:265 stop:483 length:219 start_codon:yes stop_codon:yes gene_type:complete
MKTLIAELKKQLLSQREELGTTIKNGENSLIRTKEGFLKVEGALEFINILEVELSKQEKQTDEIVEEVIGSS